MYSKDLNWKMCKKDPYNCGKGPVYTVFDLKITVFLLTNVRSNTAIIVKHVSIQFQLVKWSLLIKVSYAKLSLILRRFISFWEFFKIIYFLAFFIIFIKIIIAIRNVCRIIIWKDLKWFTASLLKGSKRGGNFEVFSKCCNAKF
jgi:hypothetical protein